MLNRVMASKTTEGTTSAHAPVRRFLLLAGLLPLLATAACSPGTGEAVAAPVYVTETVQRDLLRRTVEASGWLRPVRTLEVRSKAAGEITRVHVDVGDRVREGDILVEIDPRDVQNAAAEAEAALAAAQAGFEITEARRDRSRQMLEAGVVTSQEHEALELSFASARAELVKAATNAELARLQLEDVVIRAPLDGTILVRGTEEGQIISSGSANVSGGTVLFEMAALDPINIRLQVSGADVGGMRPGLPADVRVEAYPDRQFRAEVLRVEPQGVLQQDVVTTFPVIVDVQNPDGVLRPGMNATVRITVSETPDAVTVPAGSIVLPQQFEQAAEMLGVPPEDRILPADPGGGDSGRFSIVFLEEEDGSLTPRGVRVASAGLERSEVLAGLDGGEAIVVFSTRQVERGGGFMFRF